MSLIAINRKEWERALLYTCSPYFVHLLLKMTYQDHSVFPSSKRLTLSDFSITLILSKSMLTDLK